MDLTSRHNSKDHTTTVVQSLDEEDSGPKTDFGGDDSEQRALMFKARHIQMMALGSSTRLFRLTVGSALASSLFLQMGRVLFISGPVSMLLANILMGTVAWAMLVVTSGMLWLRVDFTWRNDFVVASPRRFHRPCQSMPFTCGCKL